MKGKRKKKKSKKVEVGADAKCKNCAGVEDLKVEAASGEILCGPCRKKMLESLEALKPPETSKPDVPAETPKPEPKVDVFDAMTPKKTSFFDAVKSLTSKLRSPTRNERIVIYAFLAALIVLVVAVDTLGPGQYTLDHRFVTKLKSLSCDDGFVYNATYGPPKPNNPGYYFCTPYNKSPQSLDYQKLQNKTMDYQFNAADEVVIFKEVCPFIANSSSYRVFVGDWNVLWKKCISYDGFAYLYAVDSGYKFVCCAPYYTFPWVMEQSGNRPENFGKVLMYNQTPPMVD